MSSKGKIKKIALISLAIVFVVVGILSYLVFSADMNFPVTPFKPRPYLSAQKYAEIDGMKISYVDEGEGPSVVFVHGLGGALDNWDYNIPVLKAKYRCIGIDLPGFGNSEKSDKLTYTIANHAKVVRGLLDKLGIEKASCVGNSMGGHTCLYFTLAYPDRIDKLVLVDASGIHDPGFMAGYITSHPEIPMWLAKRFGQKTAFDDPEKFKQHMFDQELKRGGGAGFYNVDDPNVKDFSNRMLDFVVDYAQSEDFMEYVRSSILTGHSIINTNLKDRLGEIKAPTLIFWGANDKIVPVKYGHYFNEHIKGSFLVTLKETGHVPQIERADDFNRALDRFLSMGTNSL